MRQGRSLFLFSRFWCGWIDPSRRCGWWGRDGLLPIGYPHRFIVSSGLLSEFSTLLLRFRLSQLSILSNLRVFTILNRNSRYFGLRPCRCRWLWGFWNLDDVFHSGIISSCWWDLWWNRWLLRISRVWFRIRLLFCCPRRRPKTGILEYFWYPRARLTICTRYHL